MKHALALTALFACSAAHAQFYPDVSDVHVIDVFVDDAGRVVYETEGEMGSNGPIVRAGGSLVVHASDSLQVLVVVEDGRGTPGTSGANAVFTTSFRPTRVLHLRPLQDPYQPSSPTYHRVTVLVCTDGPAPESDYPEFQDPCRTWQGVPHVSGEPDDTGFTLEINDGLGVYAAPAPPDPPVEPVVD